MVLFPEARRALELAASDPPVWEDGYDVRAARAEATAAGLAERREDVAAAVDVDADGVPCRLYLPAVAADVTPAEGLVLHLHGGGFVFHDLEVHDASARRLANRSGLAVLSIDYRKPPEHRFASAPDDVDTVLAWLERGPALSEAGPRLAGPLSVHGDSAGGNLALVAALRHPGRFAAAVLIYPFLDPTASFDSYLTADGFDPREAAWYWQQYAATPADLEHPDLAPLRSDRLATLPPTLLVTAEHDPLRDEGEELARRLAEEGVAVTATRYLGQIHGFWRHDAVFPAAAALLQQTAGFIAWVQD
jgi:acetyl esterase